MGYKTISVVGADSVANSGAVANAAQAATAPSKLFSITIYNNNVAAQWIQLHDVAATPADTAVPDAAWSIAAQTSLHVEYPLGRPMQVGIYVCNSTTDVTKTLGAADCIIDVVYRVN